MHADKNMVNLKELEINSEMLKIIAEIDEFKEVWKSLGKISPERLKILKKVAIIESIGSSTRIEGSKLSDEEIEVLFSKLGKESYTTRDKQEVAGYAFVCEEVFKSFEYMPFSENTIRHLHLWLLKYSDKDQNHLGNYKKIFNQIEAFDAKGSSLGVIFKTAAPFEVPIRMQKLVNWTNEALEKKLLHPLLIIAIFVLNFLAIHPFEDGNGRLSHILTTLLLLRTGYIYAPYSSLESIVEKNRENYYLALRQTQKTLFQKTNWTPWLLFFLKCLHKQKTLLEKKMMREKILHLKVSSNSLKIIRLIKEHGSLNITEIEKLMKINRHTLKKRLQKLVKTNHLTRHGMGKATSYAIF
jgi:Fic family protein